jgi:uncharacterized membrane protein
MTDRVHDGAGAAEEAGTPFALSLDRMLMFTDGVFAIAITILVLDLTVPDGLDDPMLFEELVHVRPELWAAALSFAVIGRFWISHHGIFGWFRRVNTPLLWLNLLLLAPVVFLPFATRLLADYSHLPIVVITYSATVAAVALVLLGIWIYATRRAHLTDQVPESHRLGIVSGLAGAAVAFLVSIPIAALVGSWAMLCYVLAVLPADRIWTAVTRRGRRS